MTRGSEGVVWHLVPDRSLTAADAISRFVGEVFGDRRWEWVNRETGAWRLVDGRAAYTVRMVASGWEVGGA